MNSLLLRRILEVSCSIYITFLNLPIPNRRNIYSYDRQCLPLGTISYLSPSASLSCRCTREATAQHAPRTARTSLSHRTRSPGSSQRPFGLSCSLTTARRCPRVLYLCLSVSLSLSLSLFLSVRLSRSDHRVSLSLSLSPSARCNHENALM